MLLLLLLAFRSFFLRSHREIGLSDPLRFCSNANHLFPRGLTTARNQFLSFESIFSSALPTAAPESVAGRNEALANIEGILYRRLNPGGNRRGASAKQQL